MTELNENEMDSVNGGYWINWPPRPSNKSSNEPDPVPLSTKPIIEPINKPEPIIDLHRPFGRPCRKPK